ncbi:MAG: dTDP-4-dehydrorhamnose reductase [Bacteroidales bacterium]|nr:dTDP-4-dehydrorhamnose reductase [Bacteroidales bacterium]
MMNILVTGSNGQLGSELNELAQDYPDFGFFFTDVDELDITDKVAVEKFVVNHNIHCIVNTAGYTAVDKAESEPDKAMLLNATSVGYLAQIAKKYDASLVHISTDYVFGGHYHKPLNEDQQPEPNSVYSRSKYNGEQEILKNGGKAVVVRTSWLYSQFGNNFVKTMIRLGKERDSLNVVFDQVGTPTYAGDLAKTILELIPRWVNLKKTEIFHYSNEGVASWYDFALAVHRIAGIHCKVNPIETKNYPLPAARPYYSVMNKEKIKKQFGITIPHWRDSLAICIAKILQ